LPSCTVLKFHWSSGPAIPEGKKETTLELVGPAYVHGFMDGQGMNWAEEGQAVKSNFRFGEGGQDAVKYTADLPFRENKSQVQTTATSMMEVLEAHD